jgi:L-ascorbate metabolism protein UlaG (beta-lactamase superfamily)
MMLTLIGGPTALLRIGGHTLLTDPTFDDPGQYSLPNRVMTKLTGPALRPDDLGDVDAVLLSHDQHWDNLDRSGREFLPSAGAVLSTNAAAGRLDGVVGLSAWAGHEVGSLTITGVPARHGPEGCEPLLGEVTGFVISGTGVPTVYVSGDNASVEHVAQVVERTGPIDIAVLFTGAARAPQLINGPLTLTAQTAVEAARLLDPAVIVPVHAEGWAHFSETLDDLRAAFDAAGLTDRLHVPIAGVELMVDDLPTQSADGEVVGR